MDPRVRRVISLFERKTDRRFSPNEIARSLNISRSRLRHLFKAETGLTPKRYLKRLRMQRAKVLMETTFLRTKEVMLRVGINDASHFVRDFKKIYGRTPAQYRDHFLEQQSFRDEVDLTERDLAKSEVTKRVNK